MITAAGTWIVGTLGGIGSWALTTEQIWFPLLGAYNRFIAPKFAAFPKLGPLFLLAFLLYGVGRALDLGDTNDET
ncbi:hypothetical protein [Haloplanus natans]|uniref:hypothetical protein n=1 Tax=Haloplanus natans TaxID=376171 RepID=UPI000677FCF3|nr:hypothetical protein [Haloplanus natans]